ncbi:phosphofructokinase [Holotrichia oblita]|nr:phosphofructokinase [Holotrichia oblita]
MKIAVLTSGGDAPGMNAAIRAVVRNAIYNDIEVYAVFEGYRGLVENLIMPVDRTFVSEVINRGGTILRTARLVEFKEKSVRKVAIDNLHRLGINHLVVIGGDGSYVGALRLSEEGLNVICIPGTIDNDIALTDFTIGFDTALQTIVDAVDKLRDTSSSHHRCSLIEVMGRYCGDLALYAGTASGAELIITGERGFDKQKMLEDLKRNRLEGKRHALVIISERIIDIKELSKEVEEYTGFETRPTVLGYVQRGGRPTAFDRVLASKMGAYAVDLLIEGVSGECVGIVGNTLVHDKIEKVLVTPRFVNLKLYHDSEKLR